MKIVVTVAWPRFIIELDDTKKESGSDYIHRFTAQPAPVSKPYTKWRCPGCDVPAHLRVNLPANWKEGMVLPKGVTLHISEDDLRPFAFRGASESYGDKVFIK